MIRKALPRDRRAARPLLAALLLLLIGTGAAQPSGSTPKFYPDDPLTREPETQDASGVQPWDVLISYDLLLNLFARPGDQGQVRAMNVNTIDEVPDSGWFTNRMLARPVSTEEIARGPLTGRPPAAGRMTVLRPKRTGMSPGFILRDAAGEVWFVQFDAAGHPEAATASAMIASKIFHALGYWQVENFLVDIRPGDLDIDPGADIDTPSGRRRPFARHDLERVFSRSAPQPNGAYRMVASRAIPRTLGGFKYHGTRPDDPNDLVPHEHRRELRALRVFGAWTNLVDMKAGNTLDALLTDNGRSLVRHYLQDVGSTFGSSALGPRDWDEGYEYLYEGDLLWKRLVSFGFHLQPWQTVDYQEYPGAGRFQGDVFDPLAWKPRVPTAAFLHARTDDAFWAARRVMAFGDEHIRAAVRSGRLTNPAAERHLGDVLIKRRDAIGRTYFTAINPLVDFAFDGSTLAFANDALRTGLVQGPEPRYAGQWMRLDNATGDTAPLGAPATGSGGRLAGPGTVPSEVTFLTVDLRAEEAAHPAWQQPVRVTFRRWGGGWQLVGVERQAAPLPAD
jgi:hypothetical protein